MLKKVKKTQIRLKALNINENKLGSSKLHKLKNGFEIVEFQFKDKKFDKLYVVLLNDKNSSKNNLIILVYYAKDISKTKTGIYDKNNNLLYEVIYDKKSKKFII